ncbi:heptosyltransferase [Deltaproteobacteria bacterium]|nr:heptosyltransferase [Deltaproteobacteria bacterium]
MEKPILILQMHRLGDMVLTFPLLARLGQIYPQNPLWVVGEKPFFSELIAFSPPAVYSEYSDSSRLQHHEFLSVINLSFRPEAMRLAGRARTENLVGPYIEPGSGKQFIRGNWQVYRASLVDNNRYNLFHWADLNAQDSLSGKEIRKTIWPHARKEGRKEGAASAHIGLFLGASEKDKRPDAAFWINLAKALLRDGHKPVLLGGKNEEELGKEVAAGLDAASHNLVGRFSLRELALFLENLDLFVTPDTGPMHLAAWTGTPILNLSIGPVNAWETGPFAPENYVLRSSLPCAACWSCVQAAPLCKENLNPLRCAALIRSILSQDREALSRIALPEQELFRTARDGQNLFALERLSGETAPRQVTALFWQAYFGHTLGDFPLAMVQKAWQNFAEASPGNAPAFAKAIVKLSRDLNGFLKNPNASPLTSTSFWTTFAPPLRPLTSYLQLTLQNGSFSTESFAACLGFVERLVALF